MRDPVPFTSRADLLKNDIRQQLLAHGFAGAAISDLTSSVDEWRAAARSAARELGRPIETIASEIRVFASLLDWPASAEEARVRDRELGAAVRGAEFGNADTRTDRSD